MSHPSHRLAAIVVRPTAPVGSVGRCAGHPLCELLGPEHDMGVGHPPLLPLDAAVVICDCEGRRVCARGAGLRPVNSMQPQCLRRAMRTVPKGGASVSVIPLLFE